MSVTQAENTQPSLQHVLELAEVHTCWWLGRYPRLSSFRDDILQEARVAAWKARSRFRPELAAFATYVFNPMRRAVTAFFEKQGVFRRGQWTWEVTASSAAARALGASTTSRTDRPTLLAEAAKHLRNVVASRGGRCARRDADVVLLLVMGLEGVDAARRFGVSKQRVHQIANRWKGAFVIATR